MTDPGLRRAIGVAVATASVVLPVALVLHGYLSWGSVLLGALGVLLWYPIDRLVLAASDARGRTDQDRT